MRITATVFFLATLICGGVLLGQSSNATITGFVQESSQAFVPGVTVTATNIQTGITVTTISNETGSYTIQSLLPGSYKLSATLTGFQTQTITDVTLGAGVTARYNFKLVIGINSRHVMPRLFRYVRCSMTPSKVLLDASTCSS